jgi:hypothetical protein
VLRDPTMEIEGLSNRAAGVKKFSPRVGRPLDRPRQLSLTSPG